MHFLQKTLLCFLLATVTISYADTVLHDTHGQNTPFSSLKNKWVLINYWASWCQSCIDEIPQLNRFYQHHKQDSVVLYAVNFDALPLTEQQMIIRKLQINYPNLLQDPARDLHLGNINALPVTFIFNPKGKLVKTLYGEQTESALNKAISPRNTSSLTLSSNK